MRSGIVGAVNPKRTGEVQNYFGSIPSQPSAAVVRMTEPPHGPETHAPEDPLRG